MGPSLPILWFFSLEETLAFEQKSGGEMWNEMVAKELSIHLHYDAEHLAIAKPCEAELQKIIKALSKDKFYSFIFLKWKPNLIFRVRKN